MRSRARSSGGRIGGRIFGLDVWRSIPSFAEGDCLLLRLWRHFRFMVQPTKFLLSQTAPGGKRNRAAGNLSKRNIRSSRRTANEFLYLLPSEWAMAQASSRIRSPQAVGGPNRLQS